MFSTNRKSPASKAKSAARKAKQQSRRMKDNTSPHIGAPKSNSGTKKKGIN